MSTPSFPLDFPLDAAYAERVYAGVLGKIVGVYLGRPVEVGWDYDSLTEVYGLVDDYVADGMGIPLVVTDDDITGTFTFLRGLRDHGLSLDVTAEQLGETWLNYLVDGRTILWWSGLGNSTEHTAYLRLTSGIPAPRSGSAELNTTLVAEQIGAQIFIDGWGMVVPGDPATAASLARRAGSVSHDGEALHAAAVMAAMESEAFVDPRTDHLLDTALGLIPRESLIARVIEDVRDWSADDGDWRLTRERIDERYGYQRYGGNVHVIPNHALIHLGLNYAAGSLTRGLAITTTSGWDTDCNAGNLGALLGLQLGLAGFDTATALDAAAAPTTEPRDWRGPIADRIWLPTAEGSRGITDAVRESLEIVALARGVRGEEPFAPKDGARFSFVFPGSVQGFEATAGVPDVLVHNVDSAVFGAQVLAIEVPAIEVPMGEVPAGEVPGSPLRVSTDTFVRPRAREKFGTYELLASPTLHAGQDITATVARVGGEGVLTGRIVLGVYGPDDELHYLSGPEQELAIIPSTLRMRAPDTGGQPIASVGLQLDGGGSGRVELDRLDWSGTPEVSWVRPVEGGRMWRHAWIDGVTHFDTTWPDDSIRVVQDAGTGLLMTGGPWGDLTVESEVTPQLAAEVGLAVRVAGLRRYHALVLAHGPGGASDSRGEARLVRREHAEQTVLARIPLEWETGRAYALTLTESGGVLSGTVDGAAIGPVALGTDAPLGGIAILITEGRVGTSRVHVSPARPSTAAVQGSDT